jgi:hypothetical protein
LAADRNRVADGEYGFRRWCQVSRSKAVVLSAALVASLPLAGQSAEAPREAEASQVFVATAPVHGDVYTYEITCTAGSQPPVDALFGRGRNRDNLWLGVLRTVNEKSTSGSSISIVGEEYGEGSRGIANSNGHLNELRIVGEESNEVALGEQAINIVLVVAPIGGTFDACSISIDEQELETRLLPDASAGYVDLGGANRNAVWTQNSAGAFGFGTLASIPIGAGPYFANCWLYGSAAIQATVYGTSNIDPVPATPISSSICGGGGFGGRFAGRIDLAGKVNEYGSPGLFHWVALKGY